MGRHDGTGWALRYWPTVVDGRRRSVNNLVLDNQKPLVKKDSPFVCLIYHSAARLASLTVYIG